MRKLYTFINSIVNFVFKRNSNQQVSVEIRELNEDQVPEMIRKQIEAKERELKEKEAQM